MSVIKVSVPGRTEVAGNHEDHQGGCVIAATVDRRMTCTVHMQDEHLITVESKGFAPFSLNLNESNFTEPHLTEKNSTRSLVRGMAAKLMREGFVIPGCSLTFTSDIPVGMGLSSSAAFELCCGTALLEAARAAGVYPRDLKPLELAQMAVQTEREFFGKPSGLMDQAICELGGINYFDFADANDLIINPIALPESWDNYTCVLVDCGCGHEDATEDYAQVALDMKEVARCLKIPQLRDISMDQYLAQFASIRNILGDRAALRGFHFYYELDLVERRLSALQRDDMNDFVKLSELSGVSSAEYLHNVSMPNADQPAMITLAFCRMALEDAFCATKNTEDASLHGAARIHGGGFGGTIQVFLPKNQLDVFMERINQLIGPDHCEEITLGVPGIQVQVDR